MGLAEVIFTSPSTSSGQVAGHAYLHLPGVVATEAASGTRRYLLSDGLGSVRHVTDEAGQLVSTHEFDPYGVPLTEPAGDPYEYTGEWWQADIGLLHLRARWYEPHSGTFLSRDPLFSHPEYNYVRSNPINRVDPSGLIDWNSCIANGDVTTCNLEFNDTLWGIARETIRFNNDLTAGDNLRINRYYVPQMQRRNPHLFRDGYGWDCPHCAGKTINLPTHWLSFLHTSSCPTKQQGTPYIPTRVVA